MLFKDMLMVQGFAVSAVSDLEENDLFTIESSNGITKCFVFMGKIRDVYMLHGLLENIKLLSFEEMKR